MNRDSKRRGLAGGEGRARAGKVATGVWIACCLGGAGLPPLQAAPPASAQVVYQPLPKAQEKVPLDAGHFFTFGFEKPPKLGMAIMRVEVYDQAGKRDTTFTVMGDADMPSMRGAHAMGDKNFYLSAKGVYLLPVRLVMPGDWEIRFTFVKDGKPVFRGAYLFDL